MLKELKKRSVKKTLPLTLLFLAAALLVAAILGSSMLKVLAGPTDLYDLLAEGGEPEGAYVSAELGFNYGSFAEETTTKDGKETSTHQMYVVDLDDTRYMALQLRPGRYAEAEALGAATDEYLAAYYDETVADEDLPYLPEPLLVKGELVALTEPDLVSYYEDMFGEGVPAECIGYYMLTDGELDGNTIGFVRGMFFVLLALVAVAIVPLVMAMNGSKLKELKKYVAANGGELTADQLEQKFESAFNVGDFWLCGDLLVFMSGAKVKLLPLANLVWCYLATTTHRTNGIKTGTTYALTLRDDAGKMYSVGMKKEDMVKQALQALSDAQDHAIVGYQAAFEKLYKKNPADFAAAVRALQIPAEQ